MKNGGGSRAAPFLFGLYHANVCALLIYSPWRFWGATARKRFEPREDMALAQVQTADDSRPRANEQIDTATRLALYRSQFEIRVVEKRAYDLFLQNLIKGTSHLAIGRWAPMMA